MRTDNGRGIIFCDRAESGLAQPHNNDGTTLRPLLSNLLNIVTAHYPGSPIGTTFKDMIGPVKKKAYISAVQKSAQANGKSFEYNYFIFMDGEIWEYAGLFLAAHSSGENAESYGVQFVNGQDDLCTDQQVLSFQWLRDKYLKQKQKLLNSAQTIPHREMPGASTACPGDRAIMPRLAELRVIYQEDTTPVEEAMQYLIQDNVGVFITGDFVNYRAVAPTDIDFFMIHGLIERNTNGSAKVYAITDHRQRMTDESPDAVNNRMAFIINSIVAKIPPAGGITQAQITQIVNGVIAGLPKNGSFTLT